MMEWCLSVHDWFSGNCLLYWCHWTVWSAAFWSVSFVLQIEL